MRSFLASAALAILATGALAQPRPKAPPPPPPQPAAPPPIAAAFFPCRSETEVCYVGVVKEGKLLVVFTNDPKAEEITGKPLAIAADGGPAPDLGASEGRLVMMTGSYDPKAGLSKAEVVDTASPLTAFAVKAALGAGGDTETPPPPPPPAGKKR